MKKQYLKWDTYSIIQDAVPYEIERAQDIDGETITEDEAFERVSTDSDLFDMQWECLTDCLTEWMNRKNDSGYWYVEGSNMGWRHQSGQGYVKARTGEELLRAILPKTDCTFTIYHLGRYGLQINNSHHDAPTGETYAIYRATKEQINAGYFD